MEIQWDKETLFFEVIGANGLVIRHRLRLWALSAPL